MIILFLMMYGAIMVFRWVGLDLGQRQQAHEAVLTAPVDSGYSRVTEGPLKQIDPYFYTPAKMNAVWEGN